MSAYHEKLIETISAIRSVSYSETVTIIQNCIVMLSSKLGIPQSDIVKIISSNEFLKGCLYGICDSKTMEECQKSCNCVVYTGDVKECISRKVLDASLINKDPDKYAKQMREKDLREFLKKANFLHFNYGDTGLTDNSFDSMLHNLNKRLKQKGKKKLMLIGAEPVEKLRVELPFPMPSLRKVYPGTRDLIKFVDKTPPRGIVYSVKLDGVSGMIIYGKSGIKGIFTRGNGEIGGDITYIKKYIKLPENVSYKSLVVRGEFVVTKAVFHKKYEKLYSTPRHFVAGQLNSGFMSAFIKDIDFVAYDVIQIDGSRDLPSYSEKYGILALQKFNVVEYGFFKNSPLMWDILIEYKTRRESSQYAIDGLVLSYNIGTEVLQQLKNPEHSVAFKALLEEQLRDTKVIDVDWRITRYGKYFPVAIYEAVFVDGIRMTRASAHNAAHIRDWNMGKGTEIKVVRSGDVLPQIKDVIVNPNTVPIFPGDKYKWTWQRSHIVLTEIEENKEVQIARIAHFFKTLNTKRVGPGTVKSLWNAGFKTIKAFTNIKKEELLPIKGFGKTKSTNVVKNINDALRNAPLDRYLIAFTVSDLKIGRKLLKQVARVYPEILEGNLKKKEISDKLKKLKKEGKLKGFGPKRIEMVSQQIPVLIDKLIALNEKDIKIAMKTQKEKREMYKKKGYNPLIKDKTFVFSGWLSNPNYDLEDLIYDNMGDLSTTVTSSITAVIVPTVATITNKMLLAHEFGIPVYSAEEFQDIYIK